MTRYRACLYCAVVVSLLLMPTVSAAGYTPTWVPTGLNPGDTYHLVFATSTTTDATSALISYYDGIADTRGDSMSGSPYGDVDWYCLGSVSAATSPVNRGLVSGPVFRLDGVLVADDSGDMWDGYLHDPINVADDGNAPPIFQAMPWVWTGTTQSGGVHWNPLGSGGGWSHMGIWMNTNGEWISSGPSPTAASRPIYAISEPLTVTVPEPGTLILAALTVAAGGTTLRRRRRRTRDRK